MRCGRNLRHEEEMHVTGNYLMVKHEEVELSALCFCGLGLCLQLIVHSRLFSNSWYPSCLSFLKQCGFPDTI